jgi:serine/threonine protein phosphatase PrpC
MEEYKEEGYKEEGKQKRKGKSRFTIMKYTLNKSDWLRIGKSAGWIKGAQIGEENEKNGFDYITSGHEDDAKMIRLRNKAEELSRMTDDDSGVHAAVYWLLSDYHGGQNSPEYSALSGSPYSPGRLERGPEGDEKMIYEELEYAYKDIE